jgi:hypothetical protein
MKSLEYQLYIFGLAFDFFFFFVWLFSTSKSLADGGEIIKYMKELQLMVETAKGIAFGNALVVEIEKP